MSTSERRFFFIYVKDTPKFFVKTRERKYGFDSEDSVRSTCVTECIDVGLAVKTYVRVATSLAGKKKRSDDREGGNASEATAWRAMLTYYPRMMPEVPFNDGSRLIALAALHSKSEIY